MRRRYELVRYGVLQHGCPATHADSISVRGTLGGYPVRRDESPCEVGDAIARIEAALGVRPSS